MFDGLYLYEIVLMVLGIILFLVLVIGFFYQLMHKRSIVALLAFFLVPVVMIGYPSIQSVQIKDGSVSIDKAAQKLQSDPTDASARSTLEQQAAKLGDRPIKNPATLTQLAKAQFFLGNEQQASATLQQALQADPTLPEAQKLQARITAVKNLEDATAKVKSNASDAQAKTQLTQAVKEVSAQQPASANTFVKIAAAQELLGDREAAAKNVATARKINPKLSVALRPQ